jgi:hypothetical protein
MTVASATAVSPEPDFLQGQSAAPWEPVALADARQALARRFDELATLLEDWDAEGSSRVDASALSAAWRFAEQALRAQLPTPEVFPVADGSVQLEWHAGPVELEIEIAPGGGTAAFVCDDDQARQEIDGLLPRDEPRLGLALARLRAYA